MTLLIMIGSALVVLGLVGWFRFSRLPSFASPRTLRPFDRLGATPRSGQAPGLPAVSEAESSRILASILTLSAYLLESHDERSVLRAAMRVGCEMLDAEGSLFVPFGEFLQTLPALEFGRTPEFVSFDYDARLTDPATRQKCKTCVARRGGADCILLHQEAAAQYFNYCVPLHQNGREAGLFSFIFYAVPQVDAESEKFLGESLRLAELALDSFRARVQATVPPPDLPADLQSHVTWIETRAILGERTRLAREIHDGLAQTLAFLKIEIGRAEKLLSQGKPEQATRILHDSSLTLSDAYLDARQAIENLRRFPDDKLESWLRQVGEDFEALTGLRVEVNLPSLPAIPVNVQVQMIRIVQEALINIRKHAAASHVSLSAWEQDGKVVVEVQDDGRGFALANSIAATRFGLRGMRERAEAAGADFQVASHSGEGTTVRLRVPLCEGGRQ